MVLSGSILQYFTNRCGLFVVLWKSVKLKGHEKSKGTAVLVVSKITCFYNVFQENTGGVYITGFLLTALF